MASKSKNKIYVITGAALIGLSVLALRSSAIASNAITVGIQTLRFGRITLPNIEVTMQSLATNNSNRNLVATAFYGSILSTTGAEIGKFNVALNQGTTLTIPAQGSASIQVNMQASIAQGIQSLLTSGASAIIDGIVVVGGVRVPIKQTIGIS